MFLLFHGPDDFSAREELGKLRASEAFGLSQDVFPGTDADLDAIRRTSETMPFLSERRLVIVEGLPKKRRGGPAESGDTNEPDAPTPTKAAGKGKKTKSGANAADPKAFAQGLADCAATVPETTTLVVLTDEALEPGNPLVKAAARYGKEHLFTQPKGARLEDWILRRATAQGGKMEREAAHLLAQEVGDDLRLLAHEVDKLVTYAGQSGTVGIAEVRLLTPSSRQARVFDLTDALARRERPKALALLHELLQAGESPLGIVALTAYQTRQLMQVKTLAERGLRGPQIAQIAGMAPFIVDKSLGVVRGFSMQQLEAAHRHLLAVDTALKNSRMTPELALDLLVVEFGKAPAS